MEQTVAARLAALEEIEVGIEKLVAGGEGLARYEGIPIFVPRSAPGDRLRVRLTERKPDYGRAEILQVLTPGPGRREPPCPYFAECGGCDLQHLEDGLQVQYKAEAAREAITRLAGLALPTPAFVVGEAWGYRLRTRLQVGRTERGLAVGYHARRTTDLVPIERCPVLAPELDRELGTLGSRLPASGAPQRIDLVVGSDGTLSVAPRVEGLPAGEVTIEAGGLSYTFDARCFFQSHRGLVGKLVEVAVGPHRGEEACDLYAGVGLFSLALAQRYAKVTAVEGEGVSARFLRNNARKNHLGNIQVVAQAVETWAHKMPDKLDRVLVDPPRAGLAKPVRKALLKWLPERLTYVSCHPATLGRDLADLKRAYRLESLTFLDLFPQTGHLETVVQLVRG